MMLGPSLFRSEVPHQMRHHWRKPWSWVWISTQHLGLKMLEHEKPTYKVFHNVSILQCLIQGEISPHNRRYVMKCKI